MSRVQIGAAAPEISLYAAGEEPRLLSSYAAQAPLLAIFLRHFG
jgi:hypothetical protein